MKHDSSSPKKISAGVIVTDGYQLLLGHVTGSAHWDIPKGGIDVGESARDAALRELKEETSLRASPSQLIYLGRSTYTKKKDLELFTWKVDQMPDANMLHCTSQFHNPKTKEWIPEFDDYAVLPFQAALDLVNDNLHRVLIKFKHLFK